MGILQGRTRFAKFAGQHLQNEVFTLLDIGCSGGIAHCWRAFGDRLRAVGFDPNLTEIERLTAAEKHSGIHYEAAYVGFEDDRSQPVSSEFVARNPWSRLSVARTLALHASTIAASEPEEKTRMNVWAEVPLAQREKTIRLPDFLASLGMTDIDFIKIDVDGPDFLILRSLKDVMRQYRVLGVQVEVNFFGSDTPDEHTFHNVDRLMRHLGFDLFDLSVRRYSAHALPAPYSDRFPGETEWGRPLQGDALYLRDLASPILQDLGKQFGAEKLSKLAALFSLARLPDFAAEVLTTFRNELSALLSVEEGLERLRRQSGAVGRRFRTYRSYVTGFERNNSAFYGPSFSNLTGRALRKLQRMWDSRPL